MVMFAPILASLFISSFKVSSFSRFEVLNIMYKMKKSRGAARNTL